MPDVHKKSIDVFLRSVFEEDFRDNLGKLDILRINEVTLLWQIKLLVKEHSPPTSDKEIISKEVVEQNSNEPKSKIIKPKQDKLQSGK